MIMEAERAHHLPFASWRCRKANLKTWEAGKLMVYIPIWGQEKIRWDAPAQAVNQEKRGKFLFILCFVLFRPSKDCMIHSVSGLVQSCPTLWDSMDCNPPGSSVYGIFQARILEWVAISSLRGFSQSRDWTYIPCMGREILYHWATEEARITYRAATKGRHGDPKCLI